MRRSGLDVVVEDISVPVPGATLAARWFRPAFEPNYYPYLPAHVTKPKESRTVYIAQLPERCKFCVPKNLKLLAVPLFEMYANEAKYGAVAASVPYLISRFHLNLESKQDK